MRKISQIPCNNVKITEDHLSRIPTRSFPESVILHTATQRNAPDIHSLDLKILKGNKIIIMKEIIIKCKKLLLYIRICKEEYTNID